MFTLLTDFTGWGVDPQKDEENEGRTRMSIERDTGRFHEDTIEASYKSLPDPEYDGGKHGPYVIMVEEVPAWDYMVVTWEVTYAPKESSYRCKQLPILGE